MSESSKTDRELLEAAAKAAGLTGYIYEWINGPVFIVPADPEKPQSEPITYDWLNDDGDALRLAVKLALNDSLVIGISKKAVGVADNSPALPGAEEPLGTDPNAAVRRAIVRCAAQIGGFNG